MLTRCAVLGDPVAHSLSPVLHRAAYAALGLRDWTYAAHEVTEAGLPGFLAALGPEWRGLSLTMPLKRGVLPLLDEVSEGARVAGAANTVVLDAGRRVGHNTDVAGAVAALRERGLAGRVGTVRVLGGGATAGSVLLALADLGCTDATVVVRDPARVGATIEAVGRHPRPPRLAVTSLEDPGGSAEPVPVDLLVSTVPASAQPTGRSAASAVAAAAGVFEVRYDPWPTPLAAAAAARGVPLVTGLDLLVHQAALQVTLMTGAPVPVAVLRGALAGVHPGPVP